jgi:hypothetical protein
MRPLVAPCPQALKGVGHKDFDLREDAEGRGKSALTLATGACSVPLRESPGASLPMRNGAKPG